jgi:Leucine-rich repeat (LRR) protein
MDGGVGFLSLSVEGLGLTSCDFLERYPLLQRVDLESNALTSVEPVGSLVHLFALSVRHNRLTQCPGFVEPSHLQAADFSYNRIKEIKVCARNSSI